MPQRKGTTLTRGAAQKPPAEKPTTKGAATKARSKKAPAAAAKEEAPFSFITVRVARLPGSIKSIALNGGRTVKNALIGAEVDGDGYEIRVNGEKGDGNTALSEGDTVLLVRKIKGND